MANFGETLRKERESRGIALDTVVGTTKISLRHLNAIESDRFDQLPGGVFNKGIVRIATRGDYDALLEKYIAWRQQFLDETGRLLPKYSPAPMALNFHDPDSDNVDVPAVARREAIPVPLGPNELW